MRKDAHPDAYSWKYITESVEHGIAQLTDRYRIFGHPETARARVGASAPVKHTRTPFTQADDAALANWVLSHPKDRTGNKIYQEFFETVSLTTRRFVSQDHTNEIQHTWHTAQSWRNRFVKSLANLPMSDLEKLAMSAADLAVQTAKSSSRPSSNQATPKDHQGKRTSKLAKTPEKPATPYTARTPQQAVPVSPSTNSDGRQLRANTRYATRKARESEKEPSPPTESEESEEGTQDAMRNTFFSDLFVFVKEMGLDIDPDPRIDGQDIDLWDLSQAVAFQKVPPEEVDWMKVAEDLGFNWVENQEVTTELQRCYQRNLAEFFEAMSSFSPNDDENDADLGDQEHSDLLSPQSDLPSSPPVQRTGRKRSLEDVILSSVHNSSKRRRLSRAAEIPSTPEEKIGVLTTQSPSVVKAKQIRQAHGHSGKVTASLKLPTMNDDEDEEDESGDEVVFETHAKQVPRLETQQSTFDVTPSQQLHSEALDASPVPLNLRQTHEDRAQQQPGISKPRKSTGASDTKPKATARTKRSLPASFKPAQGRFSPKEAEERARRPSAPIRVDLDEEGNSQDIRDCAEYYESLGYPRPIVIESLMRTTMTPGWPTSLLLEKLQNKEGIPNCEGIWTDRDDKSLRYADAIEARQSSASTRELNKAKKEHDRIVHKHTQEAVDLRRRFLQAQEKISQK